MNIKVTVGLCVKNSEKTILTTLDSVINQTYPPYKIEILIVDGYSNDRTIPIILEKINDEDIVIKFFKENEGLGTARQIVVENAVGEYIIWVDGDMVITPTFIDEQVNFIERHPDAGIAKGSYMLDLMDNNVVSFLENIEFMIDTLKKGETKSKTLATSGCIYRTKAIKEAGGFDRNIIGVGEDMDAEHRIKKAGWKTYISQARFYEIRRQNWSSLWEEYFWHGRGGVLLHKKNTNLIDFSHMLPPVALINETSRAVKAYRILNLRKVFLLPIHYLFKRIAWVSGFIHGSITQDTFSK